LRTGKYTGIFRTYCGREMGTGRADVPKGTHHTTREEVKVGWQEVKREREEIEEQRIMGGQGCEQRD